MFQLGVFHGFSHNDDGTFNGVILPDFPDVLSIGVLFITLTTLSVEYRV